MHSIIRLLSCFLLFAFTVVLSAQCDEGRYLSTQFDEVFVHTDVKYGEAPYWAFPYSNTELFTDIYEPVGDALTKRPLMIWIHPGGFLLGNKNVDDITALCDTFARRGYVTASLSYRLGYNPFDAQSSERAVYRATQDVRAAVRFFIEFSDIYEIDTNRIFIGGSSAGGFAALHTAYLDEEERPESTFEGLLYPDLGCLDCSGNEYVHEVKPLAIINLWGALGDSSYRDVNDTIPVFLMHGTADDVVAYDKGSPFDVDFLPVTHGSLPISNQSEALGLPYILHPFYGENHEPHGVSNGDFTGPPTPYWDTILVNTTQFYHSFLQPVPAEISGSDMVFTDQEQWYSVSALADHEYCWQIEGGELLTDNNDSILVKWDNAGTYEISVRALNEIHCASEVTTFEVEVNVDTSIADQESLSTSIIYPNPTKDRLYVKGWNNEQPISVEIIDQTGAKRSINQIENGIYSIHNLPAGIYYCIIKQADKRQVEKVLIQH